jgi:uncharacterized protein (DUF1015 family)
MSTIRPFTAIRYTTRPRHRDISTRLSPPYDVLDQADKDRLLAADSENFVAIDLPHTPPKSAGPPEAYEASRRTLSWWLAEGTMMRDELPMIYVYHQKFRYGDTAYTRKMFFARLKLEPFGAGAVFPHEHTFGGPKEDRLCLTKACSANLSPIFGLYEDARNEVSRLLESKLPTEPLATGKLEGVENYLWGVSARDVIDSATRMMTPRPIFIADGHHRYGTGMLHRDWLLSERGDLPPEHPANFVLCAFCAMEDRGLLILPTHRVLSGVAVTAAALRADSQLDVRELKASGAEAVITALRGSGPQAVAFHSAGEGGYFVVRPKNPEILDRVEPDHSPAWRRLGLAFLHAYLLNKVITPKLCGGTEPAVQYVKSADEAVAAADQSQGTVFLMQPTTMEELRGVCSAGDLMPHKSTYFYPKLASGLVINPLDE